MDIPKLQRPPSGWQCLRGRIWLNIHRVWRRNGYLLLFCKKRFLCSLCRICMNAYTIYTIIILESSQLLCFQNKCPCSSLYVANHQGRAPYHFHGFTFPLCVKNCLQWDDARCYNGKCIPTTFIVILATKIPNKHKISVAKTTDLLTNHIWRKNCILISFQLHPLPRSAPTLQPALESCSFFPGLVIHLGLCGTLFQSIDATSLSAKELRNTLLRCCFFDVGNHRLRAAHKRWRFKSCKKGTVHLKGTAKSAKTLVFAIPLYWQ